MVSKKQNGTLCLFNDKPTINHNKIAWAVMNCDYGYMIWNRELKARFSDVTWENSPVAVDITLSMDNFLTRRNDMTALEELLQKDCDFESWQFINAKLVLDWLWNNVPDEDLQKWHMGNIHERLNFYLFECAMSKSRQKRLKDYSISELEQEIKKRKNMEE